MKKSVFVIISLFVFSLSCFSQNTGNFSKLEKETGFGKIVISPETVEKFEQNSISEEQIADRIGGGLLNFANSITPAEREMLGKYTLYITAGATGATALSWKIQVFENSNMLKMDWAIDVNNTLKEEFRPVLERRISNRIEEKMRTYTLYIFDVLKHIIGLHNIEYSIFHGDLLESLTQEQVLRKMTPAFVQFVKKLTPQQREKMRTYTLYINARGIGGVSERNIDIDWAFDEDVVLGILNEDLLPKLN